MAADEEGGSGGGKSHRKRQAGPKAEKKKAKNKHEQELTDKQKNPKAFAFHSVNKTAKAVRRTLDIKERKHHIPVVDRTPVEPPPILVAVVGPPKVGKTTLIQCLIKNFTRQKLATIHGPVTIVSGKKRRLTFIECNNDVNSMIDLAKVADLVLLLVDASFGFEMEIFEFLNICQVHGFPRIMGVLTHLDHFKQNKVLRRTKKRLKHRFWTEVYQGAKLFYLSGMVNGEYQRTEIHNLGRFISVMKFRPLQWRTTHPYIIADRMEDVTDPEQIRMNPKVDRSICLYGYVRGTHFKNNSNIHIPGCGDYSVKDISYLADPCPLPNKEKKRSLNEKERLIYAPMSGVGGIVYDKDAVYIDLGGSHSHNVQDAEEKEESELVSTIMETEETLDQKMKSSEMMLFSGAAPITSEQVQQESSRVISMPKEEKIVDSDGRMRRKAVFEEEDDEDEDSGEGSEEEESEEEEDGEEEDMQESSKKPVKRSKQDEESFVFDESDDDDDLEVVDIQLSDTAKKKVTKSKGQNVSHESSEDSDTERSEMEDSDSGANESDNESEEESESDDDNDSDEEENGVESKSSKSKKSSKKENKSEIIEPRTKLSKKNADVASKVKNVLESLSKKKKVPTATLR